ncbi:DUF7544 domain-containing protein [Streptomyces sp. 4N509B]|uniref:DUF7544 domain-containing protein n=1 Tax=Streptomyces sp. 4N509B TaxID=3457413 RepID=UPI003FD20CBB
MNDRPGWASPGSPSPDDDRNDAPPSGAPAAPQGWGDAPHPGGRDAAPGAGHEAPATPGREADGPDEDAPRPEPTPTPTPTPAPQHAPAPHQAQPPLQPGWGGAPHQGWAGQQQGWGGQQQGWGGQHGAWSGWNPQAWAAKPGVIPLRPLGVGEILDGAVSTARAHWRTVLAIALGVAIVIQLISTIATRVWLSDSSGLQALEDNPNPSSEELRDAFTDLFAFFSVSGVVALLGSVLATAMLTIVVSRAVLGRGVTTNEAWLDSRPLLLRLLGLTLMVMLVAVGAVAVPLVLAALSGNVAAVVIAAIAGIVLAVWLWVQFSLAPPALMLERQGVMPAMRRSWKLVRGSWWRIFGITLLIQVLVTIVVGIIEFPVAILAGVIDGQGADSLFGGSMGELSWTYLTITGIGAVIASAITLPISAGVTALLYIDQRIRREALDLELARAAGVDHPGKGAPGAPGMPGS